MLGVWEGELGTTELSLLSKNRPGSGEVNSAHSQLISWFKKSFLSANIHDLDCCTKSSGYQRKKSAPILNNIQYVKKQKNEHDLN
jgi:hypothetical protein